MSDPKKYEGWIAVFSSGTDFEADLVRDRLDDAGIAAVVLTQRDHAFNLTVGDLARVHVMVQPENEEEAKKVVAAAPVSDAELEAAALAADINAPDAHTPAEEAALDSGADELTFDIPGSGEE